MSGLTGRTVGEIRSLVASGEASAVEVCRAHLERARALEPRVKAFRALLDEPALRDAERVDRERAEGRPAGPLAGVPIAVKDVLCVRGAPATCGSRILESHVPIYDATCVARLRGAGAVILGKTNMDEFAMGSSTENSAFEKTANPWALDRVPGGSSGGSAAAVAAREVPASLGTDTGGSIRQPAALCGVPGMKPTYGRVSRYGLVAFASSLDQVGPFGRTVEDLARVLQVIAGHDPADSTSARVDVPDYLAGLRRGASGLRIGVPAEYFKGGMDPEVDASVRSALRLAEGLGARLQEISLPHTEYAIPTYYIIATAEASSNLARYDGVRYGHRAQGARQLGPMYVRTRTEGFGAEVKRRIMLGTYVLSHGYYDAFYLKAQQVRTLLRRDYERAYEVADVIVMPTSPIPPFKLGEKTDDPLQMYLADIFTVSVNLAGLPGVSVPCGFTAGAAPLPIGFQVIGRMFDEATMLRVADAYERATPWAKSVAPV